MTGQISIPVATLKQAAEILLQHLETVEGKVVSLDKDYYWSIAAEQMNDVYNQPTDFTVGQLTECLDNLSSVIADPSRATSYALVWVADLMRAIGQAVVK